MKKIIPFKKELLFKTKISEITSISLEHTLNITDEHIISGEFLITGDYKITEGNINREPFSFKLPFDIALNSRYDINNIKVDIEDFYYEVIDNEILKVNIDVFVDGEELIEDVSKKEEKNIVYGELEENKELSMQRDFEEIETKTENEVELNIDNITQTTNNINIFNNLEQQETYVTYHVYMVKEEDTLEKIIDKYHVTKEELSNYNDLENIKPNDKIIIPLSNE